MAEVYVAEQVQLARRVVIKVLHPHLGRDAEVAERFRREAEAAAKLVHPHICAILDYGATQDVVFTGDAPLRGRLARRPDSEDALCRAGADGVDRRADRVWPRLRAPARRRPSRRQAGQRAVRRGWQRGAHRLRHSRRRDSTAG
jgi:hypothetical protein